MRRSGVVINMVGTRLTRRMQLELFMHEERLSNGVGYCTATIRRMIDQALSLLFGWSVVQEDLIVQVVQAWRVKHLIEARTDMSRARSSSSLGQAVASSQKRPCPSM